MGSPQKIELATPFDAITGKFSSQDRVVMRTRYGRTHAYTIRHPYTGPISQNRVPIINAFSQAVAICKTEMSNPERLAYWQDRYASYTKIADRNPSRANRKFIGSSSDKYYLTLRGFIIASLSHSLRTTP